MPEKTERTPDSTSRCRCRPLDDSGHLHPAAPPGLSTGSSPHQQPPFAVAATPVESVAASGLKRTSRRYPPLPTPVLRSLSRDHVATSPRCSPEPMALPTSTNSMYPVLESSLPPPRHHPSSHMHHPVLLVTPLLWRIGVLVHHRPRGLRTRQLCTRSSSPSPTLSGAPDCAEARWWRNTLVGWFYAGPTPHRRPERLHSRLYRGPTNSLAVRACTVGNRQLPSAGDS
uniref:Uncharacterized protein n=1 Tax=Mycena chlorophos TaxID=658473 RepID=A0ABQ0KW42_MYCCL|nr:predicted protein [Mycena chlorophos]